ncbi:uncharacterized protein IWZ02DRAFT_447221 [Phyllosticta citriasiana]|uniref:Secreted protein n=1 Tax=Phyllosticta citriasiana TaxID=595635 RepID=A0ABR1KPH2_9PEZI
MGYSAAPSLPTPRVLPLFIRFFLPSTASHFLSEGESALLVFAHLSAWRVMVSFDVCMYMRHGMPQTFAEERERWRRQATSPTRMNEMRVLSFRRRSA